MPVQSSILGGLNEKQLEAVKIVDGPVLVISGPGSGKTKCLTHRIAYLMENGVRPENILAVTFTNKAAEEMRLRVANILGRKYDSSKNNYYMPGMPLLGTFHSVCLRILRKEIEQLGYGSNFMVLDSDEQTSLIKKIMAAQEIDVKKFNPRAILSKISKLKTDLTNPEDTPPSDFYMNLVARVYKTYQSELRRLNAVDFDDLIVLTVRLFQKLPDVLEHYQNIWQHILVDEYQDTSHDQYMLLKLLARKYNNLFCIGDDAQSIYQFRKADIRNILNFQKDYPKAQVVLLEQNYRSTKNILAAAQEIISNNQGQIQKSLWTDNSGGEKIIIKETLNEKREANFVVTKLRELAKEAFNLKDCAILYRTHAQSRAIEEALISNAVPYQIVGGVKFYARKEIRDILAYLKVVSNPADVLSFERIINIPPRGIGQIGLDKILESSRNNVFEALDKAIENEEFPKKKTESLKVFKALLTKIQGSAKTSKLSATIKLIIEKTDYESYLRNISTRIQYENVEDRMENLKELLTVAKRYDGEEDNLVALFKFLEDIALLQDTDGLLRGEDRITLMTMHASKGLEYPVIFMVGLEEGLFPQNRAITNLSELEEERRLCYVAITRAKERLFITHTRFRNIFGSLEVNLPSRFIAELPAHVADCHADNAGYYDETEDKIFY
jgi:DNA helicase-2/ATP-dependent DNA helicase PcrA